MNERTNEIRKNQQNRRQNLFLFFFVLLEIECTDVCLCVNMRVVCVGNSRPNAFIGEHHEP